MEKHEKGDNTMVTYDTFRVPIPRMVDATAEGLWHEVESEREDLIREAKGLIDEAAAYIATHLSEELHPFIRDEHVAAVAAAMAFEKIEDWVALDSALYWVESDTSHWYHVNLERA